MSTTPILETSFFLIWVTSPATFAPRYLRSVESIKWHHPDAAVTVLSNTLPPRFFLDLGLQVSVERYDLEMLVRGTPAEAWYDRRHLYNRSAYFSNHLADLLRLLTLFHRGGTYVDTDVIFTSALRRPAHCRGTVGVESGEDPNVVPTSESAILCNAIMSFEAGSSFLARALSTFVKDYVPLTPGLTMMELYSKGEWGAMGPLLLTRLLLRADAATWGGTARRGARESAGGGGGGGTMARTGAAATDVCILGRDAFYPIAPGGDAIAHFGKWEEARDAPVLVRILGGGGVVAVHYWNALTRASPLICGSLMHRLFESGCGMQAGRHVLGQRTAGCVTELPCAAAV